MTKPSFDEFMHTALNDEQSQPKPQRDLWQGVERAINQAQPMQPSKQNNWQKLSGIAACTIAGLLAWQVIMNQPKQDSLANISAFFEQQKQSLLVQYETQPALTSDWQTQLQELEQAEQAIKLSLKQDPENAALLKMLAQVYQQQLDLINKVHQPRWQQI
ncbi:hypothetical protein [Pseudoalteromonas piscicida]|uniref:Uncharacterized protein n=1 Tax=Pseudoalteromonas piscicida TaxID=43662 RepID=A0AAD0W2K7_PSEO7|nr:hypothetical protein [Pseudoalteromonas piscicida]ASD68250.1 hypothetical protein B1L02_15320 [Pseudoalteromonas piscicida]AXQ99198.1 hypothetical protein D0N37_16700 [Pseudoalteromonas piscicida]AXR01039.1 hypothetical protein D0511_02405 [Pseudoalteromonas piscicida]